MKKETAQFNTAAEIDKKVAEVREKIRKANFAGAGSQAKNVKEIKNFKKEIARLETTKSAMRTK